MPEDMANKQPLPSGPSTLSFNKEEFMKSSFNVEHFVVECRRRVPMETLRDDLGVYLKILQTAMIELINKDYADFVNLSTNLVGLDKAINNLMSPINLLQSEVMNVRDALDSSIDAVEDKMREKKKIREKKACLQRLMSIIESVEKMEKLLGIHSSDKESQKRQASELSGQLIERVATEFNKLQFHVSRSRGLPLVEAIKPRIANITTTLQYSLEGSFREGLETDNISILSQCLRTYATIDKMRDAENLFRQHIVRPYMEEVISEQYMKNNPHGLKAMWMAILEFVPKHCQTLKEVTSGSAEGNGEVVRGYDFLVNAVWPEVVSNIEARTPSIFAPGNPDIFHEKYLASIEFLERFERLCGSQASVKRLRAHPSYNTFMTKWSLPVYFQIRFQEIAGSLEASLSSPFNLATDSTLFRLNVTHTVWTCLHRSWQKDVYLTPLCHRFWKLTLQILSRYGTWIQEVYDTEVIEKQKPSETPPEGATSTNTAPDGSTGGTGMGDGVVQSPPVTMGQIVGLIADTETLSVMLPDFFSESVKSHIEYLGLSDMTMFEASLGECQDTLTAQLPKFGTYVTDQIIAQSAIYLRTVNDIPRLYRRTNREVPSKSSSYVSNAVKPLKQFISEYGSIIGEESQELWGYTVISAICDQYLTVTSDVLTSVKKMEESLKRLKKGKGSGAGAGVMSDDDKIRLQLQLDVQDLAKQVDGLGLDKTKIDKLVRLEELVDSARNGSTTN